MTPPILLDIPESFESDRLLIRAPRPGDGEALQEAIEESLAELRPWMPWADEHQTVDVSEAYARRAYSEFLARTNLPLFLFRRDDGRFVGGSGLHRIDWSIPRFETGYWVRTSLPNTATRPRRRAASPTSRSATCRRSASRSGATLRRNRRNTAGELADSLGFVRLRN
jgi:RimJ/RimL family protein N-acetyltransferase